MKKYKYIVRETDDDVPDWSYVEHFETLNEAKQKMQEHFRGLLIDLETQDVNGFIRQAHLCEMYAYILTEDDKQIGWSVETADDEDDDEAPVNGRNHPLRVGEVVFDTATNFFGVIVELSENHAKLDMNGPAEEASIRPGWCEYENKLMMDMEVTEDDLVWETDDLNTLYQVAWGIKDSRTGNIVCYEHNPMDDGYPYYSPYLEENLFEFETEEV